MWLVAFCKRLILYKNEEGSVAVDISNRKEIIKRIKEKSPELSNSYIENYYDDCIKQLDERLCQNLFEWLDNLQVSDIWIGKYCVNAIMSIRNDSDFLNALQTMDIYLKDENKGISMIWRPKR